MAIHFNCPSCHFEFHVADSMSGTRARCNRCGAVMEVPRAVTSVPIDLASFSDDRVATSAQNPRLIDGDDRTRRLVAFGIAGSVAALGLLALVLLFSMINNDDEVAKADQNPATTLHTNNPPPPTDTTRGSVAAPLPATVPAPAATAPRTNPFLPPQSDHAAAHQASEPDAGDSPFEEASPAADISPFEDVEESPFQDVTGSSTTDENPFVDVGEEPGSSRPSSPRSSSEGSNGSDKGPSLSAGAWHAQADPPPQQIPVKEGRLSLALPPDSDILYPTQASQFVLVGAGPKEDMDYSCVDLSTGTFGPSITEGIDLSAPLALSADGKYMAGIHGRGDEAAVEVWSFETATRVCEIKIPSERDVAMFFARPGTIGITHNDFFQGLSLQFWSISDQKKLWEKKQLLSSEQMRDATGFAVSHGGKYAVLLVGNKLRLLDLSNGEGAGMVSLTETPSRCYGLAFSPDGKELAALTEIGTGAQLLIWDFESGKVLLNHPYFQRLEHVNYNGPALEWFPDKSSLLIAGHVLVDRETGEELWTLVETNASPRRLIKADRIVVATPDEKARRWILASVALPAAEIAKVRDTVRAGGQAIDSLLPPLTKADLSSARALTAPASTVSWTFQPDPLPAATAAFSKQQPISEESGRVQQIRFSAPAAGKAMVTREVEQKRQAGRRLPRQFVLSSLDLASGRSTAGLPLLPQCQLLDASPDGTLALIGLQRKGGGFDRLDVLSISPKKPIAGWRPYAEEQNHEHRTVTWCFMASNDRVVTCNAFGRLVVWSIPSCRAEYTLDGFGTPMCVSPSRRYLMSFQNPSLRIYDTQTGECSGDLEILPSGANIVRASFRPDGEELIAVVDGLPNKTLYRWSLKDGRSAGSFPIPDEIVGAANFIDSSTRAGLFWIDDRYVLLDGTYLIDVQNRSVVWRYHLWPSKFVDVVGGKVWIAGGEDGGAFGKQVLTPLNMPSSSTREKAKFLELERQLVLGPKSKVRVHVQLHGQYGRYNQSVADALGKRLNELGMESDAAAPLALVITSGERATGEQLAVSTGPGFGFGASSGQTFSQQALYLQFTVNDASGAALWKNEMMVPMRSFGMVESDTAQAASAELRAEMERAFDNALSAGNLPAMLPPYVFKPLTEAVAGQSTVSTKGEGPPPQPAAPNNRQPGFGSPMSPFGGLPPSLGSPF